MSRLPRKFLTSWCAATRCIGRPLMTYGETAEKYMRKAGIDSNNWQELAADEARWCEAVGVPYKGKSRGSPAQQLTRSDSDLPCCYILKKSIKSILANWNNLEHSFLFLVSVFGRWTKNFVSLGRSFFFLKIQIFNDIFRTICLRETESVMVTEFEFSNFQPFFWHLHDLI